MIRNGIFATLILTLLSCRTLDSSQVKVIGGQVAATSGFYAGLTTEGIGLDGVFCGGTFIDKRVVLTAAHCVNKADRQINVGVGYNHNTEFAKGIKIPVTAMLVYPNYDVSVVDNDVALLFLDAAASEKLADKIRPITMNADANFPDGANAPVTFIGLGYTSNWNFTSNDLLQTATIPSLSPAKCQTLGVNGDKTYATLTPHAFCAGDTVKGGRGGGLYDSGGPWTAVQNKAEVLVGLTYGGDVLKDAPSIVMRVSAFKPWIEKEVANFYHPSSMMTAAGMSDLITRFCYKGFTTQPVTTVNTQTNGQLVTSSRFDPSSVFSLVPQAAAWAQVPKSSSCSVPLETGKVVNVDLVTETSGSVPMIRAIDAASGDVWMASAQSSPAFALSCGGSTNVTKLAIPTWTYRMQLSARGHHFQRALPVFEVEATDLVGDEKLCEIPGMLATEGNFAGYDSSYHHVSLTSSLLGPKKLDYMLFGSNEPSATVSVTFKVAADDQGELWVNNTEETPLVTWELGCDVPLQLLDDMGNIRKPSLIDGGTIYTFDATKEDKGTIPPKDKVTIKYRTQGGATVQTLKGAHCAINHRAISVSAQN